MHNYWIQMAMFIKTGAILLNYHIYFPIVGEDVAFVSYWDCKLVTVFFGKQFDNTHQKLLVFFFYLCPANFIPEHPSILGNTLK